MIATGTTTTSVEVLHLGDREISEVTLYRGSIAGFTIGSRVAVAQLEMAERRLLELCAEQFLRGPAGEDLSHEAHRILDELEGRERDIAQREAQAREDARQAEERAAFDARWGPHLRQGSASLRAQIDDIDARRQRRRDALAAAEAALAAAQHDRRDLEVRRELDDEKLPAGAIAKAEARVSEAERDVRAKQAALDAEMERTESDRSTYEAAAAIAEDRAERARQEAAVTAARADKAAAHRRVTELVAELRQALADPAFRSCGLRHEDVLDRTSVELFDRCANSAIASEGKDSTDADLQ